MSIRIRVSYSSDEELEKVLQLLSSNVKSCKKAKKQEGQYKNAYLLLKQ